MLTGWIGQRRRPRAGIEQQCCTHQQDQGGTSNTKAQPAAGWSGMLSGRQGFRLLLLFQPAIEAGGGEQSTREALGGGNQDGSSALEDLEVELLEAVCQTRDVRAQRYREGGFRGLPARPAIT